MAKHTERTRRDKLPTKGTNNVTDLKMGIKKQRELVAIDKRILKRAVKDGTRTEKNQAARFLSGSARALKQKLKGRK